ncbi:acetate/propionate family kinase [Palleronia caenipelagi]|uniref:Acetate kinase n=1 Tax=Palleronia caenipelagi TaxID=2489174 RepID=A0A547PUT5_9RHOB|nr:acetate/propionate family kinase [Palleronia caenipelagi]TRD17824.1 acetate/propionate family kinase [Palleronia caenipelagi]
MTDAYLALNAGSSSMKFGLSEASDPAEILLSGSAERLGSDAATLAIRDAYGKQVQGSLGAAGHGEALTELCAAISRLRPELRITGVGHRIVHGGTHFNDPLPVTPEVLHALRELIPLAPLHQPHGILGIETAQAQFPEATHVACFDTAFHAGKPWVHESFALPRQYFDEGVRRYGFHGLACASICDALERGGYPLADRKIAIAHLGNGCSVTAVAGGRSVATSMGFTALDGLTMGTRCGRIDPGVLLHLMKNGSDADEIERVLYHQSGLLGLSGMSNDMRDLATSDAPEAAQAIAYFIERVIEEIARMAAAMRGLDCVVFSGGIGENAADLRDRITAGLSFLRRSDGSALEICVEPANEERQILVTLHRLAR